MLVFIPEQYEIEDLRHYYKYGIGMGISQAKVGKEIAGEVPLFVFGRF